MQNSVDDFLSKSSFSIIITHYLCKTYGWTVWTQNATYINTVTASVRMTTPRWTRGPYPFIAPPPPPGWGVTMVANVRQRTCVYARSRASLLNPKQTENRPREFRKIFRVSRRYEFSRPAARRLLCRVSSARHACV